MIPAEKTVGVLTTDCDLVVRSWDPWLVEATGILAVEACGRVLGELFPEVQERGFLSRLQRVVADGTIEVLAPAFHRYFIACPPREPSAHFARMQQHVTLSPLRVWGEITGVVVTIEDVTARLDRERQLAAQLHSDDEAIRLRAARALGEEDGSSEVLADALADRSWRVRRMAAEGLARGQGEEAVAALVEAVRERHRDPAVLNAALHALSQSEQDVLPAVIELLSAADSDVRTYAALALGQIDDARGIRPLVRALEDEDANVRYHAIEALGRLKAREAAEPIAAIAESRDFFLAFVALDALAAIGEPSVAPRLVPLLEDELLQGAVAEALGRLGDEEVIAPLAEMLGRPRTPATSLAAALSMLYTRFDEAYGEGPLVADLSRDMVTPEGGRNLVAALAQAKDSELRDLVRVLGWLEFDGLDQVLSHMLAHPTARRTAAEVLAGRGARAVDALIHALTANEDDETRRLVATALGQIGSRQAVPELVRLLDGSPEVVVAAAGALGSIGDRQAFEPLLSLLDDDSAIVRQAAVSALNSIGHPDMPERIQGLLSHPSPRVRESAVRIAGYFGYAHCLEEVLALCTDPDEAVRRAAVEHAAYLEDPRAIRAIGNALTNDAPPVRAAAARALSQAPADLAVPALLAAFRDSDPWVRYHAARSSGHLGSRDAVPMLRELAGGDPVPPVRMAAIEALGDADATEAVPSLTNWAAEPDDDIARAAFSALGRISDAGALRPLVGALNTDNRERQMAALSVLGRPAAANAVPAVAQAAQQTRDLDVRLLAIEVLGRIASDDAISALLDLARDSRSAHAVTASLARAGDSDPNRVARGLRHRDEAVRYTAVEALARMRDPRASRHIASALTDDAAAVRFAAARALRRRDRLRPDSAPDAFLRLREGTAARQPISDAMQE